MNNIIPMELDIQKGTLSLSNFSNSGYMMSNTKIANAIGSITALAAFMQNRIMKMTTTMVNAFVYLLLAANLSCNDLVPFCFMFLY